MTSSSPVSCLALVALLSAVLGCPSLTHAQQGAAAMTTSVSAPPTDRANSFYVSNRAPLVRNPLLKLPIGSITPEGWLHHMLVLEAEGMTGHLDELSQFLPFEVSAWASPTGEGRSGWEELPYWLKGYGDLGYVLKDEALIRNARRWIEAVLASAREDGWFGPRGLLTSLKGKPDLWPHMVMLNALQSYYEATGDKRVLTLMADYFRWELNQPEEDFLAGFWGPVRAGDNMESVQWLYNRTGEEWLLHLVDKIQRRCAKWTDGIASWHGVNISQAFRQPAHYYVQTGNPLFLQLTERNYDEVWGQYGQVPGGSFGADENCRPGYTGPRQGYETCSTVEFMHSAQLLTAITGNPLWADRCEEMCFNTFPPSQTPDLKSLHYLVAPNQVQLDHENKAPLIQNQGNMFAYDPYGFRCCQHNVAMGWPYYAEHLWMATQDNGLAAILYAACQVEAQVGDGTKVRITQETDYPFGETVTFTIHTPQQVSFPLYLRIPRWCTAVGVSVNGQALQVTAKPLSYLCLQRTWQEGDRLELRLPMQIQVRTWQANNRSVSVDRGPLTYSLKIGERWQRFGGTDKWPAMEVYPTTPWNYGLVLDAQNPAQSFEVHKTAGPVPDQPFTVEAAPIQLTAKARRIPQWQMERTMVGLLQDSPAKSTEPLETVTLIPMGCARLRISAFPTIGDGPDAVTWKEPAKPEFAATASHCWSGDSVAAVCDGVLPRRSSDQGLPRFTWWDHRGTTEWVQLDFLKARKIGSVEVYWFDDTGVGQCRVPQSWTVLHRVGDRWEPVKSLSEAGAKLDQFNSLRFTPVETTAIRLEVKLQDKFSGGILEMRVGD